FYWLKSLPVLYLPDSGYSLDKFASKIVKSIFTEVGISATEVVRDQEPNFELERKILDDIVFDAIGLTQDERKEVYWAVCELVQRRLQKAKSV
ncbi:MAG: hypothetical protein SCARUB_04902, partial [Candidatus Scalindua rubra]